MNICLLNRTYINNKGGIESYTYSMAKVFASMGHVVHIVANSNGSDLGKPVETHHLGKNIIVHDLCFKGFSIKGLWKLEQLLPVYSLLYSYRVMKKLKSIIKTHAINIIESPDFFSEAFIYMLGREVPVVVRLHGYHNLFLDARLCGIKERIQKRMVALIEKKLIDMADGVTSVSSNFSLKAREIWNIKREIEVIHNGIDLEDFYPQEQIRPGSNTVLFVGRLEETKGIRVFINAIPQILKEFPKTEFYLAGKEIVSRHGDWTIEEHIKRVTSSRNIHLLGELNRDEIIALYSKKPVCVVPSLYEPFGLVALEAMACGCPTIASNVGGFKEIIENGKDGVLIEPGDEVLLANTVTRLLKSQELREALSSNAIAKAHKVFEIISKAKSTVKFYEKVISQFNGRKHAAEKSPNNNR